MISIRDLLDAVPGAILRRGEDYYENESILSLSRSAEGIYSGRVCGSGGETYKVQVRSSDSGEVSDYSCTCPYDYGDVCKHIVAVLLAIEDGNYQDMNAAASKVRQPASPIPELPELLKDLPRGKLLSIILNQAELDEGFKSRLILETAPPDIKSDLAIIREKIRRAIRVNTDRDFIDDTGCDAICDELSDCLDLAKNRMDLGQTLTAFEVTLLVLLTGADLMSNADSSSGSLSYVMDESFAWLEEICGQLAEKAEEADRKACYDRLCREALNKVFNGWKEWSYDLLKIAALLVTEKNRDRMEAALKALKDTEEEKSWPFYEQTQEDLIRLEVIQVLEGEKAARAFINSRLENERFRELAYQDDLRKGDYANAEKLCLERIRHPASPGYGRPSDWWYRLYEIHEKTDNREGLLSTAKALLLQGDIEYYGKLKGFLQDGGNWEETYPLLRSELKTTLPGFLYMQILDLENEHALLLEEVKRDSSAVFRYGNKLAERYPKTIYDLYRLRIIKAARESSNRSEYSRLCGLLRELHQAGGKDEALALADEFALEYRRRPAMMDELAKLRRRLAQPSKGEKTD